VIGWYVAPTGALTVSTFWDALMTWAFTAPKKTMSLAGMESKLFPDIVTVVPTGPLVGAKEKITGKGLNVNPASVEEPWGDDMLTLPVAPLPTIAEITVSETTLNDNAGTSPKLTDVAPENETPAIFMVPPAPSAVG
jgi:hypothetical protein